MTALRARAFDFNCSNEQFVELNVKKKKNRINKNSVVRAVVTTSIYNPLIIGIGWDHWPTFHFFIFHDNIYPNEIAIYKWTIRRQ